MIILGVAGQPAARLSEVAYTVTVGVPPQLSASPVTIATFGAGIPVLQAKFVFGIKFAVGGTRSVIENVAVVSSKLPQSLVARKVTTTDLVCVIQFGALI